MLVAKLSADDWRTILAGVGAVAGGLAFLWNVVSYFMDRRPKVRVWAELVQPDEGSYDAVIRAANRGRTVETVTEIGLCWPKDRRNPVAVSAVHATTGRPDTQTELLRDATQAIQDLASGTDSQRWRARGYNPRGWREVKYKAWPLAPGDLAEAEVSLIHFDDGDPDSAPVVFRDAPMEAGKMLPYVRLASGKSATGAAVNVIPATIDFARTHHVGE